MGFWSVIFVATALEASYHRLNGWRLALDVAVTDMDPFLVHTWLAVVLVVVSVFLVPVLIGSIATLVVAEQIRQMRISKDEMRERLTKQVDELHARLRSLETPSAPGQPTDPSDQSGSDKPTSEQN